MKKRKIKSNIGVSTRIRKYKEVTTLPGETSFKGAFGKSKEKKAVNSTVIHRSKPKTFWILGRPRKVVKEKFFFMNLDILKAPKPIRIPASNPEHQKSERWARRHGKCQKLDSTPKPPKVKEGFWEKIIRFFKKIFAQLTKEWGSQHAG